MFLASMDVTCWYLISSITTLKTSIITISREIITSKLQPFRNLHTLQLMNNHFSHFLLPVKKDLLIFEPYYSKTWNFTTCPAVVLVDLVVQILLWINLLQSVSVLLMIPAGDALILLSNRKNSHMNIWCWILILKVRPVQKIAHYIIYNHMNIQKINFEFNSKTSFLRAKGTDIMERKRTLC